jgi:hypothetical protein
MGSSSARHTEFSGRRIVRQGCSGDQTMAGDDLLEGSRRYVAWYGGGKPSLLHAAVTPGIGTAEAPVRPVGPPGQSARSMMYASWVREPVRARSANPLVPSEENISYAVRSCSRASRRPRRRRSHSPYS